MAIRLPLHVRDSLLQSSTYTSSTPGFAAVPSAVLLQCVRVQSGTWSVCLCASLWGHQAKGWLNKGAALLGMVLQQSEHKDNFPCTLLKYPNRNNVSHCLNQCIFIPVILR